MAQTRCHMGKRHPLAKIKAAMFVLEAMNGPLDGKRWVFDHAIIIGRDAGEGQAALPVDRAVSRRHAQISAEVDSFVIVDFESSNGTILRGQQISGPARVDFEEPFVVGRTMLRVLRAADSTADKENAR